MRIETEIGPRPLAEIRSMVLLYNRRTKTLLTVASALLVPIAGCMICGGWAFDAEVLFVLGIGLLPLAILTTYLRYYRLPYGLPGKLARQKDPVGPVRVVIDDLGIRETAETAKAFHKWDAVKGYREDQTGILIYYVGGLCLYLPKRLLAAEALNELKQVLDHRK
jgi:hypothetical protein